LSLIGVLIAVFISRWGLLLSGFVALNLVQSSFTGFCPAERVLERLGVRAAGEGPARA
jgi:hypothetical protein